jgi:ribosome-binding factor A
VLKALRTHTAFFQKEVAGRLKLKYAARIKFLADESFDEAFRIDALLADPRVRRDLEEGEETSGDESEG